MRNSPKEKLNGYSYLMMLGHICTDMSQGALPALLPFLVAYRGIDYASAAGLMFAASFLSSLIQPVLGMMTDRKAMPWLMAAGMFISGLGITLVGFLSNYWAIFALVMFSGIGSAMFHPEAGRMSNCVAGEKKGRGMSIFAVGGNIGFVVGPIITTLAVSAWGLKGAAIIMLPVLLIVSVFIWQNKHFTQFSAAMTKVQSSADELTTQKDDWKGFGKLTVSLFSRSIVINGVQVFIPLYWVAILHQTQELGSSMVTVMAIAAAFSTLLGGRMADKFGFKRVILTSFALLLPLLILLLMAGNVVFATIALIPLAAAIHLGYSPSVALGQKYLPNRLGLASGVTLGLSISVGGVCSPILGAIGDRFGLTTALYVIVVIAFIGLLGAAWIRNPQVTASKEKGGKLCLEK